MGNWSLERDLYWEEQLDKGSQRLHRPVVPIVCFFAWEHVFVEWTKIIQMSQGSATRSWCVFLRRGTESMEASSKENRLFLKCAKLFTFFVVAMDVTRLLSVRVGFEPGSFGLKVTSHSWHKFLSFMWANYICVPNSCYLHFIFALFLKKIFAPWHLGHSFALGTLRRFVLLETEGRRNRLSA